MNIDGSWQEAERCFDVINPADGPVLESVTDSGAEDARRASVPTGSS